MLGTLKLGELSKEELKRKEKELNNAFKDINLSKLLAFPLESERPPRKTGVNIKTKSPETFVQPTAEGSREKKLLESN